MVLLVSRRWNFVPVLSQWFFIIVPNVLSFLNDGDEDDAIGSDGNENSGDDNDEDGDSDNDENLEEGED